ncbi:MAG: hypothetical protein HYV93_15135 [Candidatus Rokubacteria bacterium]|nr:hypothetical protein [Candidatus Rokubacteria bacterium]
MRDAGRSNAVGAPEARREARLVELGTAKPVAGVPGPGRWLVVDYGATALFSLKISLATSSVGKTLIVPTPYAVKMAYVDGGFRAGWADADCRAFLRALVDVEVRVAPPGDAVVTHTFVKVRQESRQGDPLRPYIASIAYREVVHHRGMWQWAFDLAGGDDWLAGRLVEAAPHVSYVGKRGSFIQFGGIARRVELGSGFTQPLDAGRQWAIPLRAHIAPLDDFGPEASLEVLSSFTETSPRRERHRRFVQTVIPIGLVNSGPGFSEYRAR